MKQERCEFDHKIFLTVEISIVVADESISKEEPMEGVDEARSVVDDGKRQFIEEKIGLAEEDEEEEVWTDRLTKEEVVNCICQINEENGLMIQVMEY